MNPRLWAHVILLAALVAAGPVRALAGPVSRPLTNEGEVSLTSADNTDRDTVLSEMAYLHKTAFTLDQSDSPGVYRAWKAKGFYDEVARRLGYRLRLIETVTPERARPGGELRVVVRWRNDGFARVLNPRLVDIVLRHAKSGERFVLPVREERGNRLWLPGPGEEKSCEIRGGLPKDMPEGDYDLLFHLPDPYPSLYARPEYAIRLANVGTWEPANGLNRLLATVHVEKANDLAPYEGSTWFFPHDGRAPTGPRVASP